MTEKKVYGETPEAGDDAINAGPNVQAIVDSGMTPEEFAKKHPNVPIRDEVSQPIDPAYDAVTEDTDRPTQEKVDEINEDLSDDPNPPVDEVRAPGEEPVVVASPASAHSPSKPSAEPKREGVDQSKVPHQSQSTKGKDDK